MGILTSPMLFLRVLYIRLIHFCQVVSSLSIYYIHCYASNYLHSGTVQTIEVRTVRTCIRIDATSTHSASLSQPRFASSSSFAPALLQLTISSFEQKYLLFTIYIRLQSFNLSKFISFYQNKTWGSNQTK